MATFGERLKELRIDKQLNQTNFGKIFNVEKGTVSNWENENRFPDKNTLNAMADFFNVSLDYLLGRSNIKDKSEQILTLIDVNESETARIARELYEAYRPSEAERKASYDKIIAAQLEVAEALKDAPETSRFSPTDKMDFLKRLIKFDSEVSKYYKHIRNLAMHAKESNLTDKEAEDVKAYIDFLVSRRNDKS